MSADELIASWAKLQHDLQIKNSATLAYVLTVGQQMRIAGRRWVGAAYSSMEEVQSGSSQLDTLASHGRAEALQPRRYMELLQQHGPGQLGTASTNCCAPDGVLQQLEAPRKEQPLQQQSRSQQHCVQQQQASGHGQSSHITTAAIMEAAAAATKAGSSDYIALSQRRLLPPSMATPRHHSVLNTTLTGPPGTSAALLKTDLPTNSSVQVRAPLRRRIVPTHVP